MAREGDIDWQTQRSDYNSHQLSRQGPAKKTDTLKPLEGNFESSSESRNQFSRKVVERQNKVRPQTSILQDGDIEWETNKRSDFKEHQMSREGKKKVLDHLSLLDGNYDWETNKKSDFKAHKVTREGIKKKGDNLGILDGDFDWETNKNSDFKEHQISREGKKKMDDNLKMLDGSYDWETNKRSDFKEHQVSRQGTKKVGDNLGPLDGDYDWETNKKSDFKEHQVSKQQLSRIQDNLKPLEGKMKSKTEARKQFNAKSAQRQQPIRPSTVIGQKGEMEFKTHKDEDYRYYDGVQKLQQLKAKNNLHVMDKNFKLEGTTVARSTYQGPSHDVISDARISRSVAHKTSLAPLDGPLEGVSETKGNFTHKEGFERVQQVKHEGHLDLLRGVPFAPKSSTSMNDYQADLFSPRPAQIHYEDNLIPNGGIESDTSYKMSFDPRKVKSADVRPRPDWVETLITPFGPYAAGEARRPGQNFQVNATA